MKYWFCLLPFLPLSAPAQTDGYSRSHIIQLLQEGAWEHVLNTAASAAPADTFMLQSAGYAAYQSGDKPLAQDYYDRVLALDSNHRQALYYTAVIHKGDEEYRTALPLLERLCRIAPTVATYRVLLADCYSATNAPKQALSQLKAANELSPSSPNISGRLANAYIRLKSWDSADRVLTPALASHPNDVSLLSAGITLAYYQKKWTRTAALSDSMIATQHMRYEPMLTALYGDIEAVNWKHAVRLGEVLMALGNETEEVLYSTAFAHQHLRNFKTADTLLRKCVRKVLKPTLEQYYRSLAEVAESLGDISRAGAYYDTAYYLFKSPFTLYQKGIMLNNAGRKKESKAAFEKYLALPATKQDTAIARWMRKTIER